MSAPKKLLLFASERAWARAVIEALRARGLEVLRRPPIALIDMRRTRAEVAELRPEAAVMLDGFAAEADPALSFSFNTEAPVNLAMAALEFRAVPVLCVPSAVAAGAQTPPVESEPLPGADDFSDSLLRGERFLLRAAPHALVLRAGPILSRRWATERLREGVLASPARRLSPLSSEQLAEALLRALSRGLRGRLHLRSEDPAISAAELWGELQGALGGTVHVAPEALSGHQLLASEREGELGGLGSWREALLDAPSAKPPEEPQDKLQTTPATRPEDAPEVERLTGPCAAVLRVQTTVPITERAHPQAWRLLPLSGEVRVELEPSPAAGVEASAAQAAPRAGLRLPAGATARVHTSGAASWLELLDP